ncbi:MAG: hypothetical protein HW388_767 [Dehalococcoidia bacterium]|nr:hypothetical protein [Dehalococcoidia bacterium]
MVASHHLEAYFVIDDRQRILRWSSAAALVLGVPEDMAVGRSCYEVVRGHDSFGKDVCRPHCPAFEALQRGSLTSSCSLLVDGPGGRDRFWAKLVALPDVTGGALATLVERPPELSTPAGDSQLAASLRPTLASAVDIVWDLAALGALVTNLSYDAPDRSIERVLDGLRQVTEAEIAELFLVEPRGRDMLLTTFRGPFPSAFMEMTRFPIGEGFPGLVLSQGEPISTSDLLQDARYLRTRVKEKGFHSYVCQPLRGPKGIIGVLNVATRRPDMDMERARRFLSWVSVPLSTMLDAASLKARLNAVTTPPGALVDTTRSHSELLRGVLRRMMAIGDAGAGALFLLDRELEGLAQQVTEGAFDEAICPHIQHGESGRCPALLEGHGMALYGPRYRWSPACQHVSARGQVVHCLPLISGEERIGIIQLRYAAGGPSPPTRYLATLLDIAEEAALAIKKARDALQEQARAVALESQLQRESGRRTAHAKGSTDLSGPESPRSGAEPLQPLLDIRCFGSFELQRRGKLVTPDMVQRRGALTLLKILLVHAGRPVSRDVLVELLWPEAEPRLAANRLHVLMHALRQVVEPSPRERQWAFICREGDRYYLDTNAPYRLDVQEFRRYVDLGERLERDGDVAGVTVAYEAAANLYRGDFLEDEIYAEWCWEARESLRERYLDVVGRLAGLYLEQGHTQKSLDLYRRGLRADPLREETQYGLIRALWLAGWPAEALRQYEACRALLERELSVAPSAEIELLVHQIRDGHKA